MAQDPVCGMKVNEKETNNHFVFENKNYYFCTPRCLSSFRAAPQKYLVKLQAGLISERKVVIVGTGGVGATFAFNLMISGLANSIVLIDVDRQRAEGNAMDLQHGLSFVSPTKIQAGDYTACKDADIVVVTAGIHMRPGMTRIDLVQKNLEIFKEIISQIVKHNPRILLIVSNPVDVLTYAAQKLSDYPMNRVIGSGTVLDTSRFRYLLARKCDVDARNVHAYIIGEHGDSELAVWSLINIGGIAFESYCASCGRQCDQKEKEGIFQQVRNAAYEIVQRKGGTSFAVSLALMQIVTSILRDENRILTVSTLLDHYHGISDVCLSVPVVLNGNGITKVLELKLDDDEKDKLQASSKQLKGVISTIRSLIDG